VINGEGMPLYHTKQQYYYYHHPHHHFHSVNNNIYYYGMGCGDTTDKNMFLTKRNGESE